MKTIYNNNGKNYRVMEEFEEYMLLENMNQDFTPYVVAYRYDEQRYSWSSGKYFREYREAVEYLDKIKNNRALEDV